MDAFAQVAVAGPIIRYSQVWEDCAVLGRALAVGAGDDVLSIGSAGDNVLSLLLDEPRTVTAIDLNPAQIALIELKRAALRMLSHDQFVALLGTVEGYDRAQLYQKLRPALLSPLAREFWDARPELLAGGVMHAGRLDRYFRAFQREHLSRLVPAAAVDEYLDMADVAAQTAWFERWFEQPAFKQVLTAFFSREMQARQGRDASQLRFVGDVDVFGMLWQRFRHVCTQLPARGNFYLEYFLTGRYRDLELGPPYLRAGVYPKLRQLVERVQIVTAELGAHLDSVAPGHYSKANLSDLFEYLSAEDAEVLFERLGRALRKGGRLGFWNLFVPRAPRQSARWRSHGEAAEQLLAQDRAFFYSAFHLLEVVS